MIICRFADDSDVAVWRAKTGVWVVATIRGGTDTPHQTASGCVHRLEALRDMGFKVPQSAFDQLEALAEKEEGARVDA